MLIKKTEEKMKKIIAFISTLLVLGAAAFADVSVKKLDNGQVEVTFFYGNPRATEVLLAGDFTNWADGAEPMEKGDKGFTLVKVVSAGTVMKYKFISDGNWTEDLREPDKVDDGFGGYNGLVDVDELVAALTGDAGAGTSKRSSIKFMTWTMVGAQGKFLTQGVVDKTKKGMDFDNATVGAKSYNKLTGNITPEMPFYVELAVAETELDSELSGNPIYMVKRDSTGALTNELPQSLSGLLSSPMAWLGKADDNSKASSGPGSNPYLGHLKFGFETPWVNYNTGFNYAKQDKRQKILWTTIDGNWDAGYQHVGGFASFSTGSKVQNLFADSGVKLDAGFVPNKSADRKGTKYGYIGWAGAELEDLGLTVDFQSNGMYAGDVIFKDAVEHDFILGAKERIVLDDIGSLGIAVQGLAATHQKTSADLGGAVADYTGYSTDVFYRSGNFGLENIAAELRVGFDAEDKSWGVTAGYRLRGAEASMLFLRENHDDGTFDLSETLGVLNSQNIGLGGYVNLLDEALSLSLDATVTLPLTYKNSNSDLVQDWYAESAWDSWYKKRCASNMEPLFGVKGGARLVAVPTVSYKITEDMSVTANAKLKFNALDYDEASGKTNHYGASDSQFLFNNAGIAFSWNNVAEFIPGLNVYYGIDNANSERLFNTLVCSVAFPEDLNVSASVGLKTVKGTEAGQAYNKDENNMFGFALGVSKKIKRIKSPVLYAQFVFNMDPYKGFGDGQDQLALNGANVSDRWDGDAAGGVDAVDYYDGWSAVRCGIRWDF